MRVLPIVRSRVRVAVQSGGGCAVMAVVTLDTGCCSGGGGCRGDDERGERGVAFFGVVVSDAVDGVRVFVAVVGSFVGGDTQRFSVENRVESGKRSC